MVAFVIMSTDSIAVLACFQTFVTVTPFSFNDILIHVQIIFKNQMPSIPHIWSTRYHKWWNQFTEDFSQRILNSHEPCICDSNVRALYSSSWTWSCTKRTSSLLIKFTDSHVGLQFEDPISGGSLSNHQIYGTSESREIHEICWSTALKVKSGDMRPSSLVLLTFLSLKTNFGKVPLKLAIIVTELVQRS